MEERLLSLDVIRNYGRQSFPSSDNEFTFRLSNITEIPKLRELHGLLQDKTVLSLANLLLELSSENEVTCNDGKFQLLELHPDHRNVNPKNKTSQTSEEKAVLFIPYKDAADDS